MQQLSSTTKSPFVNAAAREVLDAIPPVMWFIRRQMRTHRGGLSMAQFRSLVRADNRPQATLSSVAEHLGATLPTASRIVDGLVDKGLLNRIECRWDRRQVLLELTPRGKEVLQKARKATQRYMELELGKLSRSQHKSLIGASHVLKTIFAPAIGAARAASGVPAAE